VLLLSIGVLAYFQLRHWNGTPLIMGMVMIFIYLTWILFEAKISIHDLFKGKAKTDKHTCDVYAISQGMTVLTSLLFEPQWVGIPYLWLVPGYLLFGCGIALRIAAIRALGKFYSHQVRVDEEHKIIESGPYHWMRHPAYSGMLIAHLGFVVFFFNWLNFIIFFFLLLPAIIRRIIVEEQMLTTIGEYKKCFGHKKRLLPFLW
jgi:protein-S-isoprenylcysteine O-methyltransferase Ste14